MQLVDAHQSLAQTGVAVQLVKVPVNGLDQVGIDADRHLGIVERSLLRRFIAARLGEELELLDLRREHPGKAVFIVVIDAVVAVKCVLAERAVIRFQAGDVGALRDLVRLALAVERVGEFHIGIGEQGEHAVRRVCHLPCRGQQLFLRLGEDVRTLAADFIEMAAI